MDGQEATLAKLMEMVQGLANEVRALRKEAREDREAREMLASRKAADAARQASFRERRKSQESNVTSRDSNVTPEVVSSNALDLDHDQKTTKIPALRNNHVTSRNTGPTWDAYSAAFEKRHRAKPVRNATTNSQMAQFVRRIGEAEAPAVAVFYVGHNLPWYKQKSHSVGLLLQDAESLRTQWANGHAVTATASRQQDQTQANLDGWEETRNELVAKRT